MSAAPVRINLPTAFAAYLDGKSAAQGDDTSETGKRIYEAWQNSETVKLGKGTVVRLIAETADVAEWVRQEAQDLREMSGNGSGFSRAEIEGATKAAERASKALEKLTTVEDAGEIPSALEEASEPQEADKPVQPRKRGFVMKHVDCRQCYTLATQARNMAAQREISEATFETASHEGTWRF